MNAADKYISALQERFPNITAQWNPPPDPIFETTPCSLEFHPKSGSEEPFILTFKDGLGNNPIENDIEILIAAYSSQIDSL